MLTHNARLAVYAAQNGTMRLTLAQKRRAKHKLRAATGRALKALATHPDDCPCDYHAPQGEPIT